MKIIINVFCGTLECLQNHTEIRLCAVQIQDEEKSIFYSMVVYELNNPWMIR